MGKIYKQILQMPGVKGKGTFYEDPMSKDPIIRRLQEKDNNKKVVAPEIFKVKEKGKVNKRVSNLILENKLKEKEMEEALAPTSPQAAEEVKRFSAFENNLAVAMEDERKDAADVGNYRTKQKNKGASSLVR